MLNYGVFETNEFCLKKKLSDPILKEEFDLSAHSLTLRSFRFYEHKEVYNFTSH